MYRQVVGIPIGTNCAPVVANLFLFCYERDFILSLYADKQAYIIDTFYTTSRYLDDILNINNVHFDNMVKVSKGAKIRNRCNQVPHLTQDTNGKVTNSQLDTTNESQEVSPFPAGDHKAHINTTNESQEVSPFPAGDHKAHINRRAQRHSKHKTEQKHKISTKEVPPWNGQ